MSNEFYSTVRRCPDLSWPLYPSGLGRLGDALQAAEQAVQTYRRLAKKNPEIFEPDLVRLLNILGSFYAAVDKAEEALTVTRQSAEIRECLAKENPSIFEPDFAMSLSSLGVRYSEVGKPKEALRATLRAVEIYQCLPWEQQEDFEPQLARSPPSNIRDLCKQRGIPFYLGQVAGKDRYNSHLLDGVEYNEVPLLS